MSVKGLNESCKIGASNNICIYVCVHALTEIYVDVYIYMSE